MSVKQAKALVPGFYVHHKTEKNADGTPVRMVILGIKTWKSKRNAHRVLVSTKYGLYSYPKWDETNVNQIEKGYEEKT